MTKNQCLSCCGKNVKHETRDLQFEYKGERLDIPAMVGSFCADCGDAQLDAGYNQDYFDKISAFTKAVDAKEGAWLTTVIKKLDISNQLAVAMAGGGKNAFAKYRAGDATPVSAVKTLFGLLERHPDLVNEVAEMPHVRAKLGGKRSLHAKQTVAKYSTQRKPAK